MRSDGTMVNAFVAGNAELPEDMARMLEQRARHLGPAYRLFYRKPLHIVRGEDVWLIDADGKRYLDAYNNVACVGHCHPHVVQAIARQAAILSTNTRYLSQPILDYAARLLEGFPQALSHLMFTCTGSEANDLAVRLAKDFTGHSGFIVTNNAYHGVTDAVAAMSPSLGPGVALGDHVRTIAAPLDGNGEAFAARLNEAIADLARLGVKPAAFICDTIFSSDGVAADPAGFLKPAVDAIRAAGGLFIADEVQPGFGRTGAGMWGFARHGLVPDMVSLGKPMGNGYPVAGLVMQPRIVEGFGAKARYFNTFGGNSVAIAAAGAVLDVIERQHLITNARETGGKFLAAIGSTLAGATVRGAGLFIGADIVDAAGKPDAKEAARIVNGLREEGVLISATGPLGHVLKIRPPLTFTPAHADFFLEKLKKVAARS